jgi:hypothetical protein
MSTPSLVRNGLFDRDKEALGDACVGEFTEGVAHTPESIVKDAVAEVKALDVQALVTVLEAPSYYPTPKRCRPDQGSTGSGVMNYILCSLLLNLIPS